jgi:crotonobetainyl-CoA:carnitine CoA-transferase CaiB-like acyl-CoA transferase
MSGPLNGVRVLDLTGVVSGPLATMYLADQGADALKIEPIGGDITRRSRAATGKGGEFSALFISSNRGKRSLSIDIKSDVGREVLARLVAQADVLVQNFRPGTMERLGLGPDELRKRHPRLIYVSISGVGERGPYVKKRVYDPIIQGLSGFADIQSQPITNRPQMIRTIVCDKTTAIFTAQALSSALYAREKTGQGDHIQVAMLDVMISHLWPEGMMQYTVVGAEATTADPMTGPISCSSATLRQAPFRIPSGRASAGRPAIPNLRRMPASRRRRRARPMPPRVSTGWRNTSLSIRPPSGWSGSTPPTFRARRSCAAARSSTTSRWWRAASSRSLISRWSGVCGSRSRRAVQRQ